MSNLTEWEKALADDFYAAIQDWSKQTDRSQQQASFRVGVSDLGFCSEKVRRMLLREEPTSDPDKLAAFLGTWIGAGVEQAVLAKYGDQVVLQSEVSVLLETDEGDFTITGHPDMIFPEMGLLLDNKSVNRIGSVSSYSHFEENQQQRFQRNIYGYAAWQAGMFPGFALEDVKVGNVWIDRSGEDHELFVRLEHLDLSVVESAKQWLSEVVYAYKHDIEARKEPPRNFCENWCEFYETCRKFDTDATGLIEDPEVFRAIDLYERGKELEREGAKLKSIAKNKMVGVEGSTGTHIVRWVHVEPSVVPESVRKGHDRLMLTKIKESKK